MLLIEKNLRFLILSRKRFLCMLKYLDDQTMLNAYYKAVKYGLGSDFINILKEELHQQSIA
jgi:hypothetical protein